MLPLISIIILVCIIGLALRGAILSAVLVALVVYWGMPSVSENINTLLKPLTAERTK